MWGLSSHPLYSIPQDGDSRRPEAWKEQQGWWVSAEWEVGNLQGEPLAPDLRHWEGTCCR